MTKRCARETHTESARACEYKNKEGEIKMHNCFDLVMPTNLHNQLMQHNNTSGRPWHLTTDPHTRPTSVLVTMGTTHEHNRLQCVFTGTFFSPLHSFQQSMSWSRAWHPLLSRPVCSSQDLKQQPPHTVHSQTTQAQKELCTTNLELEFIRIKYNIESTQNDYN